MELRAVRINPQNKEGLVGTYKEVFKGHPWHEDLICANSVLEINDPKKCMVQYTKSPCEKFDLDKKAGIIENDCRECFVKRFDSSQKSGIIHLNGQNLEKCIGCGDNLRLIDFYPDFTDHISLIDEAVAHKGFVGYILKNDSDIIGFSWGYDVPHENTKSVKFSLVTPELIKKNVVPEETFYGAEVGIVDKFQNSGHGTITSGLRIAAAANEGKKAYVTRTINPYIISMLEKMFSGTPGEFLFKDPERDSSWYRWDMQNLNRDYLNNRACNIIHE